MRRISLVVTLGLAILVCVSAQAQQPQNDPIRTILNQYDAKAKKCWQMRIDKKLRTYKDVAVCADTGLVSSLSEAGYPYTDLFQLLTAQDLAISERADAKKITEAEGRVERAQAVSQMVAEIQRRNIIEQKARADAAAADAQAQQIETETQARAQAAADAQAQLLSQMQAQAAADAEIQRRAALARFSAGIAAPTRTGSFGESMSNGLNGYAGLQPPAYAAPPAQTQTVCQRFGYQVICNSQ